MHANAHMFPMQPVASSANAPHMNPRHLAPHPTPVHWLAASTPVWPCAQWSLLHPGRCAIGHSIASSSRSSTCLKGELAVRPVPERRLAAKPPPHVWVGPLDPYEPISVASGHTVGSNNVGTCVNPSPLSMLGNVGDMVIPPAQGVPAAAASLRMHRRWGRGHALWPWSTTLHVSG